MAAGSLDFSGLDEAVDDVQDQATDTQDVTDNDGGEQGADQHGEGDGSSEHREAADDKLDGRRGPANIRNTIKAATEALPDQAQHLKELGNAWFREAAYREQFATVQEATSARQLIESVGGVDGVTQLQQRDAMYQAQDVFLKEGNPEILDDFATDFPEGFAALAPHYLEKLAKTNPEALSAAVVPYAMGMLQNVGFGDYLKAITDETDPAKAKALVQRLSQWFNGEATKVQQMRQVQPKNPAADRVREQQTKLDQEREQLFTEGVNAKIKSNVEPKLSRTVEQYGKKNGWNDEQKQEFRARLLADIAAQMDGDDTYKKQADLRYANKQRTHDTVATYIAGEFVRRMDDKDGALATEAKVNKLFGRSAAKKTTTGVARAGQARTSPGGGPLRLSAAPADDKIDWGHKDAEVWFLQDKAKLKDGRVVTWRK